MALKHNYELFSHLIARQSIGETTADVTGNWLLTTFNLADGTYNFTATATDIAGTASDSGTIGDKKTKFDTVTVTGQTEANVTVVLEETGAVTTSDHTGKFTFANVTLAIGNNTLIARATDIAGNEKTYSTIIKRLSPPTAITLTTDAVSQVWFSTSDNSSHPSNYSDRLIHILIQQRPKPSGYGGDKIMAN